MPTRKPHKVHETPPEGELRPRCGYPGQRFSDDPDEITCLACLTIRRNDSDKPCANAHKGCAGVVKTGKKHKRRLCGPCIRKSHGRDPLVNAYNTGIQRGIAMANAAAGKRESP